MNTFDNYDTCFPDLILDIMEYFEISSGDLNKKSILNFCTEKYPLPGSTNQAPAIQPEIVDRICNILVNNNEMSRIKYGSPMGLANNYTCTVKNKALWTFARDRLRNKYNSFVYGFEYIYRHYQDKVIPIVHETDDKTSIGTCFKLFSGLVTAKHCIEGADRLSIKGYASEQLNGKTIYTSTDENIDIAYIEIGEDSQNEVFWEPAEIMQEVITMGFPRIPQFRDFLNAERATTSSISEFSVKPSVGSVSAVSENYLTRLKLILITAKIRGGNSGSPVINRNGSIVGIACQIPEFDGNYDDLGYGIVTPVEYLVEMLGDPEKRQETTLTNFVDFVG